MSKIEENNGHSNTSYDMWAVSMEQKYDAKVSQWPSHTEPCTIHRVPHSIRAVDVSAYEPTMLSIGPYHHSSNPKLQAMEDHKWRNLQAILRRDTTRKLCDYLELMKGMEERARSFYSENVELGSREFVEMMLLDSGFIIALFLNFESEDTTAEVKCNPIYSTKWILPIMSMDMLLLENQLPFFVLECIFELVRSSASNADNSSLTELALRFFDHLIQIPANMKEISPMKSTHHLLHLYHWHLIPTSFKSDIILKPDNHLLPLHQSNLSSTSPNMSPSAKKKKKHAPPRFIPSATKDNVRLGRKSGASTILDVGFENDVLEIPALCINHSTNSVFRNLIALEQCYPTCGTFFMSYAVFMNCLIDSAEDVQMLRERDIIEHWFGDDEQVAHLFNRMCDGISFDFEESFLFSIFDEVTRFVRTPSRMFRAFLLRNYFDTPLALMNFQITIMTITLTLVHTCLAVLTYIRDSKP